MGETEGQSSSYVVLGIGWVLRETQEWVEAVHSGQDRRTSPTGCGLHGRDGHDHRERNRGYLERSGYGCWWQEGGSVFS